MKAVNAYLFCTARLVTVLSLAKGKENGTAPALRSSEE